MSIRKLFPTIFGMVVLSSLVALANAQMTDEAARDQVRNTVRSQLHLRPDQFLGVERHEELEQLLTSIVARPSWSGFIYKVSQAGDEIKENVVVHHIFMDVDFTYIVAISPRDGSTYRIHGFGLAESLAEFQRLMTSLRMQVSSPDQAESVAEFYRKVNPENQEGLTPILSLLELKQAAERQCQTVPFDPIEKKFNAWWKHAKSLYAQISFEQTATPLSGGYLVEWVVLSSAAKGNCGGAPLQARLEVKSDGYVGSPTFSPLQKPNH
jgi:hypothetical protein